jgi:hypothetical protein
VSLPALDYAGAVSESALRRDGEGRSPMDPLRVTGSVGRGVNPSGFAGGGFSSAPADRGNPASRTGWNTCPRDRRTPPLGTEETCPGERRGNLPPWDRWGNSLDADRTLRAGEQDGSAQNRRARSAGSFSPCRLYGLTARRSAPPHFKQNSGVSRGNAEACARASQFREPPRSASTTPSS